MSIGINDIAAISNRVLEQVERAIIGKRRLLRDVMAAVLTDGHVLLEDFPGLGKTLLAKSFAAALGLDFKRIQFTPDLLPGDITGGYVYNRAADRFELRRGPIFANIVLADEINRASPKTQSALLEAMQEQQVTLEGETMSLAEPFIVLATQNPIEYEGTFPLPEAQLDRFLLRIRLGYPEATDEMAMLDAQQYHHPVTGLRQVVTLDELREAQAAVRSVYIDRQIKRYIVDIVSATRNHDDVYLGASPRGSLALYRASQARAALAGRDHVLPDDVKALAIPTLAHRIIIGPSARIKDITAENVIAEVLKRVPVPGATLGID